MTKNVSAEVEISLRSAGVAGGPKGIPLEPFSSNKDMGRILLRRGGETIAAGVFFARVAQVPSDSYVLGIVLEIFG